MLNRTVRLGNIEFKRVTKTTFIKTVKEGGRRFDYAMGMDKMRFPLHIAIMDEVEECQLLYPERTYEKQVERAFDNICNRLYFYTANKEQGYKIQYFISVHH